MVVLQAGELVLARRIVPSQQDSGFREGPLERGIADLRAGGPIACAGGFLGTFDEPAIGHDILDPWAAGDVMHLIEQDQTQNLADAGNGL